MIKRAVEVNAFFEPAAAALMVQTASKFQSRISLNMQEKTANAKSIMGIISLDLQSGNTVTIIADGEDEQQAIPALEDFLRPTPSHA